MKNHFYFSYIGNKRMEVEYILDNLNLDGITTIIEPFCGSCALSYYISTKYPNKFKYILNDIDDKLIELLNINKDEKRMKEIEDDIENTKVEITKEKYLTYIKNNTLNGYIFKNKYYAMRPGMFPIREMSRMKKPFKFTDYPIYHFLTTEDVEIYNKEAIDIIKEYDNDNCLVFLDPPYINSCNVMYKMGSDNIYEYITRELKNLKSKCYICHENNWIFKLLFRDYIKEDDKEYYKKYQMRNKKETNHILISNVGT